ncbi:hypothetical protein Tco_1007855, partial [Tanacetum coccineum]
ATAFYITKDHGTRLATGKKRFDSINELISSVKYYAYQMETEIISWKKQALSLVDKTQSRVVDLVVSYVFKGGNKAPMPAAESVRNDVLGPAILESQLKMSKEVWSAHSS